MFENGFVHIGTEKTGSSSIQAFMCLNREPLRQRGALYPQSLGPLNHRKLRNYAASDHTHLMGAEVREHPGGTEGFRADVARDFDLEIAGTSCGSLIVSDEHFHSALATRQEIQRLADFLRRCCKVLPGYHLSPAPG